MNVYIENFQMSDLLSENEKPCKPLSPLHVSGVMDERFFQHEKNKKKLLKMNRIGPFNSFRHVYDRRNESATLV